MTIKHAIPLILFVAACTVGDSSQDLDTNRLRNGANADSTECQECAAEVEACLVSGDEDCAEMYFECEAICVGDEGDDDAGDDDPGDDGDDACFACDDALDECLEQAGDDEAAIEACWTALDECAAQSCDDEQDHDAPTCESCDTELDECLAQAGDDVDAQDECYWLGECCAAECQ